MKHSIVNAFHAIELLLKERLRRVHPSFIWERVDEYPKLDKRTVAVDLAISRLESIAGVAIAEEDKQLLKSLRATRNAIEHYQWSAEEREVKVILGNAISFALSFAKQQLEINFDAEFKRDDTWTMLLQELYEFKRAHGRRIAANLRQNGRASTYCEECGEETVPWRGGSCELCGHWQELGEGDDDGPLPGAP